MFKLTTVGAAAGKGRPPQAETAESEKFFFVCAFLKFLIIIEQCLRQTRRHYCSIIKSPTWPAAIDEHADGTARHGPLERTPDPISVGA